MLRRSILVFVIDRSGIEVRQTGDAICEDGFVPRFVQIFDPKWLRRDVRAKSDYADTEEEKSF